MLVAAITPGAVAGLDECAVETSPIGQLTCYAAAAKATNATVPCDHAANEGVRYQCYAMFAEYAESPGVCHSIPATTAEHRSLADACLSDVARKARKPGICEYISAPGLRDSCYLKLALDLDDAALCAKVRDAGLNSTCSGKPVIVE